MTTKKYSSIREHYQSAVLKLEDFPNNPITIFTSWLDEVLKIKMKDANAMCLSTLGVDQSIHQRQVLLKEVTEEGLTFYTNYESQKARDIENHAHVGLNFFWRPLSRQINVRGVARKLSLEQNQDYFAQRPRSSQLGAWASKQSESIKDRSVLIQDYQYYEDKFKDQEIPLPPFWGGYMVEPYYFEFWQGADLRLHDRIAYEKEENGLWGILRLSP